MVKGRKGIGKFGGMMIAEHVILEARAQGQQLKQHRIAPDLQDELFAGEKIDVKFAGNLRSQQSDAIAKILMHDERILCAAPAFENGEP